jgi:hypothetical protein
MKASPPTLRVAASRCTLVCVWAAARVTAVARAAVRTARRAWGFKCKIGLLMVVKGTPALPARAATNLWPVAGA